MSHTPGPWEIRKNKVLAGSYFVANCGYEVVWGEDQCEANARLIAAAPDLLEALIAITDQLERIGDTRAHKDGQFIEAARAAIAKAEGK